jgi:hypothetical protein
MISETQTAHPTRYDTDFDGKGLQLNTYHSSGSRIKALKQIENIYSIMKLWIPVLYKDTKKRLLLHGPWSQRTHDLIREAYIVSSISSKINTLTAPDRLRLMRSLSTREPGLWR